ESGITSRHIYLVQVNQPNRPRALLNSRFNETYPEFSPDGHWIAYCSDESGRSELYVQPYPGPGKRVLITTDGAAEPLWSRVGQELFYRSLGARNEVISVRFKIAGNEFIPQQPVKLFEGRFARTGIIRSWDIAADGRFLMLEPDPVPADELKLLFPATLRIVLNWTEELKHQPAPAH
ncbi:MAG: hypothetical protein DMG14_01060, partial [Acidobacteria bacterium]